MSKENGASVVSNLGLMEVTQRSPDYNICILLGVSNPSVTGVNISISATKDRENIYSRVRTSITYKRKNEVEWKQQETYLRTSPGRNYKSNN